MCGGCRVHGLRLPHLSKADQMVLGTEAITSFPLEMRREFLRLALVSTPGKSFLHRHALPAVLILAFSPLDSTLAGVDQPRIRVPNAGCDAPDSEAGRQNENC